LLLIAAFTGFVPVPAAADDPVVARVNDIEIKQSDLDYAASEVGPRIASLPAIDRKRVLLQYLIENELMAGAGQKDSLDKADNFPGRAP
jgi:peptidyl-prolyl cis-trans isomerase C